MARPNLPIRAEFETYALTELRRAGVARFDRAEAKRIYLAKGVPLASVKRWLTEIIKDYQDETGDPASPATDLELELRRSRGRDSRRARIDQRGQEASLVVAMEAAEAGARATVPVGAGAMTVLAPAQISGVLDQLQECITAAQDCMRFARTPEGGVKNSRLLLTASENLRRAIETFVKLHESVMDVLAIERFHQAIFDVLRSESPELAARVHGRLAELNQRWIGL